MRLLKSKNKCSLCGCALYKNTINSVLDEKRNRVVKICNACMNVINSREKLKDKQ